MILAETVPLAPRASLSFCFWSWASRRRFAQGGPKSRRRAKKRLWRALGIRGSASPLPSGDVLLSHRMLFRMLEGRYGKTGLAERED
jgi:hypothetical protein